MTFGGGAFGLLRQHRQRGFETVCEIARLRERSAYRLVAVIEERVEIIHQRLHFGRIPSIDPAAAAVANAGQSRP